MTIAQQAKAIEAALTGWVKNNKGSTFVTADALDVLDQLRARPGAPTAAVLFFDEQVYGDHPELGRVLRTWKIVITRGRGLKVSTGESLTGGVAGGEAMFDLVEQAREVARGLRMEDMEGEFQPAIYKGTGLFEVAGYILDAFEIRFSLYAQNPRQEISTEDNEANEENPTE